MIPLAAHLLAISELATGQGRAILATTYHTLHTQAREQAPLWLLRCRCLLCVKVWALLPGFLSHPCDIVPAFRNVARLLGSALTERPDLRAVVCRGLQNVIKTTCLLCRWSFFHFAADPAHVAVIASYAKNFLPVLFNVFTTCPEEQKRLVVDTIEVRY